MIRIPASLLRLAFLTIAVIGISEQSGRSQTLPSGYADLADLTLTAPVIVRATISKAEQLRPEDAGRADAGQIRLLVTAKVTAAIRSPDSVPAQLTYLWDSPTDAKGRAPKPKGQDVLLFLRPVLDRPGQYQLVAQSGQRPALAADEATIHLLLTENASGKVPEITGISGAFRVPGSILGEAESQFFLITRAKPIALVLLTRPGQPQRLSVALGDVIDDSAVAVQRDTLLWYRLACFLPRALPGSITDTALAADYAAVLVRIGDCNRTKR